MRTLDEHAGRSEVYRALHATEGQSHNIREGAPTPPSIEDTKEPEKVGVEL